MQNKCNSEVLGFQWKKETSRLYIQQQNNKKYLEGTNFSLQSYWPDFIYPLNWQNIIPRGLQFENTLKWNDNFTD